MSRVLVTGASGFVGRHCLPRLVEKGYEVHAISSQQRAVKDSSKVAWHQFDLLHASECRRAVSKVRPTHLLHLAWIATPGAFWTSSDNLQWLVSSTELFRGFFDGGGNKALGVGTCAEYKWIDEGDLAETASALCPASIYGQCKAAAGFACLAAAAVHSSSALWIRLFYPYGPGEPAARLIPSVISGLLERKSVRCSEGSQLRDFTFVEDIADGLVELISSPLSGVYNLGTGNATSVRDAVDLIASTIGRPDLVTFGEKALRSNDPPRIVADTSKLERDSSWRPKVTLREGIERTIKEYRANHH